MTINQSFSQKPIIAVIGLGYVGLPLAVALSKAFEDVIGFDSNPTRIGNLIHGIDKTGTLESEEFSPAQLRFSSNSKDLAVCNVFIVAVPTPLDTAHRPDLSALKDASETVSKVMQPGSVVCYESTVYPGVTEDICGPILEKTSGLTRGKDFFLGYSPERINPGDSVHRLETITKVVAAENEETLDILSEVYGSVVKAGIYRAPSIRVAEAAKVIENTQRDLNIALMNELALVFDRMSLRTEDVLQAAETKWNFISFRPGLVGGHCIGVDPYYLTYKSEELGYIPQVILAGRRINDTMGRFIAEKTVKLLCQKGLPVTNAKVGILGVTFKENVPDLRNSRVPEIFAELKDYGINPIVVDDLVDPEEALKEYGLTLNEENDLVDLDALVLAVPHERYLQRGVVHWMERLKSTGGVFVDVKSKFDPKEVSERYLYWSL
ncbi:MAG: UDP-N-acetyl-D-glucosamine/UDP-N-acetyl-D-galactosamine dehydrogenase [Synergistales bacterium]|nr:UDP-N-acetyl-D-glucosamine/UDP-N-acetyl-D-galactosamine dehydrogenase [Synergistales bacterium]